MPERPVVNASPLVVLARAGKLDFLRLLGDHVVVPRQVADEVRAHSDEAARALDAESWIEEAQAVSCAALEPVPSGEVERFLGPLVRP